MELGSTPSQTIGPFFAILLPLGSSELVPPGTAGAIRIKGRVFDGLGAPVTDAMLETWHAAPSGRYAHPEDRREDVKAAPAGFQGFGRCMTDSSGRFALLTLKPGPLPGTDERLQAPHINVSVFARGLLKRLVTRIYFDDEPRANASDPVLAAIADPAIRSTLIASSETGGTYRFDLHLQGEKETAFFAV